MMTKEVGVKEDDEQVLRFLVDHFREIGAGHLRPPFVVPGVAEDRMVPSLRDLYQDGLIEGVSPEEVEYPVLVTGVTSAGRQAVSD